MALDEIIVFIDVDLCMREKGVTIEMVADSYGHLFHVLGTFI